MGPLGVALVVIGFILFFLILSGIRVVPHAHTFIVERFGKYHKSLSAGLNVIIPIVDKVTRRVSLKEQVADFPPQPVITKDNVTMRIDTVVYYCILDPKLYAYGVENPIMAIENITATTLRNVIGSMELDETLTSRDEINTKMRVAIDEATDPWGIKVNRVELKNIMPPAAIQEAMEKQMKAERERRESILIAEGEKKSAVLRAEGEKEAAVLRAEAQKIELVKEAEGHAESIRLHKQAEADGIEMLKATGFTTEQIVKIKSLEAFAKAADGQATKIIIPSEIQGVAGLAAGLKESVVTPDPTLSNPNAFKQCIGADNKVDSQAAAAKGLFDI